MRLALFDLDNTLVDRASGVRAWALRFCERQRLDEAEVPWLVAADGDGLVPKEAFFRDVRARYGLLEDVDTLVAEYRSEYPTLPQPFPGVLDGLAALRGAGWAVGVATNGRADVQLAVLTSSGVARNVDGWAISGGDGVRKPDPRLFEFAARRCGAAPAGGWMTGDSLAADIAGGRAAGMHTIWIDRGLVPSPTPTPDHIVTSAAAAIEHLLAR